MAETNQNLTTPPATDGSRAHASEGLPRLAGDRATTQAEVAQFRRDGHVCVRELASADEVRAYGPTIERTALGLSREKRALEDRDTYSQAFLQVPNLWLVDPVVTPFVLAERFARVAAELLGVEGVRLYHDQALIKEARGGYTPWHQDKFYWPLDTDATITMWMPLVDVPAEVGSMRFMSGTHERGHLGEYAIGEESERVFGTLAEKEGLEIESHGAMAAGDATFHHGWTLHSAPENPTNISRPVMTIIYFADGARVTTLDHANHRLDQALWMPGREPGEAADTPFNPCLWPGRKTDLVTPKRDGAYWKAVALAAKELGAGSVGPE
jgi:ectoine hydroxylase-related dioxygenase (phytanoyl-CoA dioxygenase family)